MPLTGQLYIFGDSLSDDGATGVQSGEEPVDRFFFGRASNGPLWHEYIRDNLAVAPAAASISQAPNFEGYLSGSDLNGVNFAHGGAVSSSTEDPNKPGAVQQAQGFASLVDAGDIPAPDDQDLFAIWIGGNDFLSFAEASILEIFQILSLGSNILGNIETSVETLAATGARNFLLIGQPTVGGAFLGDKAQGNGFIVSIWNRLAEDFNDALETYAAELNAQEGTNALYIDFAAFVQDLEDNPEAYGFANVDSDIFADDAPTDDQSYFSVDGIHPTGAGHEAIANYIIDVAEAVDFDLTALAGNVIPGTFRDDTLTGTGGNDSITGGLGDDEIDGKDGTDIAFLSGASSLYTLLLGPNITLADRSGADGTDVLTGIETLNFDGEVFALSKFDDATSLTSDEMRALTEVYLSYFNRAPDAKGLMFWANAYANGTTLDQIADAFAMSEEGQALFPLDAQLFEFVTAVYQNTLGRVGDDAGVNFWTNALQSGGVGRGEFVLRVLEGARADPPSDAHDDFIAQQQADQVFLDTRVDIGVYYATILGLSDFNDAVAVMAAFDGTPDTIDDAKAAADSSFEAASATDGTGAYLINLVGVIDDPFV